MGSAGVWSRIARLAPNTTSYADTSVAGGQTYTYQVLARYDPANADWSNRVTVRTPSGP